MVTDGAWTTQKHNLFDFELLDRSSELINEDGSRDDIDPLLTTALMSSLGFDDPMGVRAFLRELTNDIGIATLEDLNGETLTNLLEGILS